MTISEIRPFVTVKLKNRENELNFLNAIFSIEENSVYVYFDQGFLEVPGESKKVLVFFGQLNQIEYIFSEYKTIYTPDFSEDSNEFNGEPKE